MRRRLAAMLYEGLVLFGVWMVAGFAYFLLTAGHQGLQSARGVQVFMFVVLGVYFVWFWTHGGQTVAMKTWQVRLVSREGAPVSKGRALLRYLASWMWFVPVPALVWLAPWKGSLALYAALALAWIGVYAASSLVQRERQFWHDVLCGTRLVRVPGTMRAHDQSV